MPSRLDALRAEVEHLSGQFAGLQRALDSRDLIGMAKGLIMARQRCGPDEAFDVLRRASQRENRKLVDVASWLVDQHAKRTAQPR